MNKGIHIEVLITVKSVSALKLFSSSRIYSCRVAEINMVNLTNAVIEMERVHKVTAAQIRYFPIDARSRIDMDKSLTDMWKEALTIKELEEYLCD